MPSDISAVTVRVGYAAAIGLLVIGVARFVQRRVMQRPAAPPAHVLQSSDVYIRPVAPRVQRSFTKEELAPYNGVTEPKIYVSVKNEVFEVAPQHYAPGAPYHVYAGKEISRALAKSLVDDTQCGLEYETDVTPAERDMLQSWYNKFKSKYAVVGWYVPGESFYQLPPPVGSH